MYTSLDICTVALMIIIARVSFKALRTMMVYSSFRKIANSKILRAEQLLEDHEDWQALDL